jgi:hypothetical protein
MMKSALSGVVGLSPVLSLFLLGVGCVPAEEDGNQDDTAEIEQASSWGAFASWARQDNLPTSSNRADIGSDAGMSCFLAGVAGNLSSSYGAQQPSGTLYTTASARVYRASGRWFIEAQTGSGTEKINTSAMCLNIVAGRTGVYSWSGGAATLMLPVTSNRRCFLTAIKNSFAYYSDDNFTASTDEVRVWNDGLNWYIGGNGNAQGSASCIDVSVDLGETNWANGTINLAYNDMNPGTQCMLTGVRGVFRSNSWSNGIFINYNAGLNQYTMSASSGKRGWARCVK